MPVHPPVYSGSEGQDAGTIWRPLLERSVNFTSGETRPDWPCEKKETTRMARTERRSGMVNFLFRSLDLGPFGECTVIEMRLLHRDARGLGFIKVVHELPRSLLGKCEFPELARLQSTAGIEFTRATCRCAGIAFTGSGSDGRDP